MKFKNSFIIILACLLFASMSILSMHPIAAQGDCQPTINLINQDPTPAVPDSYVQVVFEVSGIGNCNGFAVQLQQSYPFSLDPGVDAIQTITQTPYVSSDYANTWNIPYKIRVAQDALEGDYTLKLLYHGGTSTNFESLAGSGFEKDFNITVTDTQTDFDVVVQQVSSGQVSLGIVNTGKNTANSVIVKIPQQQNFRASGISEQILGNLAAGDYTLVSFNIASSMSRNLTRVPNSNYPNSNSPQMSSNFSANNLLQVQIDYTDGIAKRRTVIKEVSAAAILSQGNFTSLTGSAGRFGSNRNSGASIWVYILIIVVIIIAGFFVYKKYGEKLKDFFKKKSHKKSSGVPEWVLAERSTRKK